MMEWLWKRQGNEAPYRYITYQLNFASSRIWNLDLMNLSQMHYLLSHVDTPMFVCVEVLQPSQSIGVISSVVSLPNHTFTGQA